LEIIKKFSVSELVDQNKETVLEKQALI